MPGRSLRPRAVLAAVLATILVISGCAGGSGHPRPTPGATADPGLDSGLVHTRAGLVRGQVGPDVLLFQGIPYAAPPVGALRWRPPQPPAAWQGMRDASKPGPRCLQDASQDPDFGRLSGEDCLSLNVWSPRAGAGAAPRPVMVWIHGGGFANGSADLYNAHWLVTKGDIIVVTVNYRLGAPGFLAHPALAGPEGSAGNYGLSDQQAALRWVRDNIAAFGGDPDKVTIAGESAGGMSVCDHLVSPGSAGLFRAAIIASGPCQEQADITSARRDSITYAHQAGCPDDARAAVCLRALPPAAITEPPWFVHIGKDVLTGPVTGTPELPVDPVSAIEAGTAAQVPVLIGTTRDEFTLFTALQYLRQGYAPTPSDYPGLLNDTFGAHAAAVGAHYPVQNFGGNTALAYSAAVTDGYFSCLADQMAAALSRRAPVYAYEFSDRTAPAPEPLRQVPFPVGASHSLDLRYLFDIGGAPPLTPAQQQLSDQMIGYWTHFVSSGVPGFSGAPVWPEFGSGSDAGPWMSFDAAGSRLADGFRRDHQCAFWAGLDR